GWTYRRQPYTLPVTDDARQRVAATLTSLGWRTDAPTLGVNVGAGTVFANKMWPASKSTALILRLIDAHDRLQVVLLGGPGEREAIDAIRATVHTARPDAPVF